MCKNSKTTIIKILFIEFIVIVDPLKTHVYQIVWLCMIIIAKIFIYVRYELAKKNGTYFDWNKPSYSHLFVKSHDYMTWVFIFILYNVIFFFQITPTDKWCTLTLAIWFSVYMNVEWMAPTVLYKYLLVITSLEHINIRPHKSK